MTESGRDAKIVLFLTLWMGNFHSETPLWPFQCFLITQTQPRLFLRNLPFLSSSEGSDFQSSLLWLPTHFPNLWHIHPTLVFGGPEVMQSWIPLRFPYQVVSTQPCSVPSNGRLIAPRAVAPNLGNSHQFAVFLILIWNLSSSRWSQFCQLK